MNVIINKQDLFPANTSFLAKEHKLFIGGKWVESKAGKSIPVEDPATQEVVTHVPAGEKEDIDAAVKAARKAFEEGAWPNLTSLERSKMIWRLGDLLEKHADELAQLEVIDTGKPLAFAQTVDIPFATSMFHYMSGWPTRLCGEQIPVTTPGDWHVYSTREPVGVAGAIIPWNFPLNMLSWKVAPALAAGCTVVLKPAEQTPLTALRFAELAQEAGFPDGVINIVTGYGETAGAALAEHEDVDKIAFTGSTEGGKMIARAATGNLKRVSLELGGKSPAIVLPDADLQMAIEGTANAIFFNQGQVCTAASRLYAHKDIYDQVVEGVAKIADSLTLGHGLDPNVNHGPLISQSHRERVASYVEIGREEGADVVTGGKTVGNQGHFMAPTVLARTSPDMRVVREEIFGPVVCVQAFDDDDLDKIAKIANDTEYGLAASVWTQNLSKAHLLARKIKAGTVSINVHNFADATAPFGGYKKSGWGREMGREVMDAYTETKTIAAML